MFKPGDKIECILGDEVVSGLATGRIYTVSKKICAPDGMEAVSLSEIPNWSFYSYRFVPQVTEVEKMTCEQLSNYILSRVVS